MLYLAFSKEASGTESYVKLLTLLVVCGTI